MIARVLAIAGARLRAAVRSRLAPLTGVVLVLGVPLLSIIFADPGDARAWLSRGILVEGLRIVLPVAAIVGGAFLLQPKIKAGWTILPARRAEYFIGTALAGCVVLGLAAALFAGGSMVTIRDDLKLTEHATGISKQRMKDGKKQVAQGKPGTAVWANPGYAEELVLDLPDTLGERVSGTVEFQLVWTTEAPPQDRSPVAVWLQHDNARTPLEMTVQSRYRIQFEGENRPGSSLIVQPTDPVLIVGTSAERVRFDASEAAPTGSIVRLWLISVAASVMCLLVVLAIRALATSPTAVLAGLLLLATLTMLPSLAPTSRMSQDRRAAMQQGSTESKFLDRLEARVDGIPQLMPETYFDEFLAARVVPGAVWADAGWRLLIGLLLTAPGALLFRLRQIAN